MFVFFYLHFTRRVTESATLITISKVGRPVKYKKQHFISSRGLSSVFSDDLLGTLGKMTNLKIPKVFCCFVNKNYQKHPEFSFLCRKNNTILFGQLLVATGLTILDQARQSLLKVNQKKKIRFLLATTVYTQQKRKNSCLIKGGTQFPCSSTKRWTPDPIP